MKLWRHLRKLFAYLAPEPSLVSPRNHIAVIAALLAVAAIAGAVVLTPPHHARRGMREILHQRLSERAEVDLFDDFSQGLDDWQTRRNLASTWSYDRNGFVNLGALSFFEPSMHLQDYDVDALVQVEARGLGIVFRAASGQNYQVAKLVVEGSGPMATLELERYAVLLGQAARPVFTRYPGRFESGKMNRVHLEVRGHSFSLYIDGKLVDFWSDTRSFAGGVGLFCSPGERARVAWLRVSHNTDSVGRICSFLDAML